MNVQTQFFRRVVLLSALVAFAALAPSCSTAPTCKSRPDTSPGGDCWFSDCRLENAKAPYPNPVSRGGALKLDMSCGGATRNMQFINTSMQVSICNTNGQQVTSFTVGPFPPNSNIQQVPIWSNVNVAAGTYLVTVVADLGPCGTKTLISSAKVVVV